MTRPIVRSLFLFATSGLLSGNIVASPRPGFAPDDQNNTTKKSTANPKKPAAKSSGDADKIKTDDRMSTRGLKPPPKDADKDKSAKPEAKSSGSDSTNPK
jgi:hypothetical protein